ncbi:MAG: hypothetical protein WDN31_23320 [Hyphomicrobium sp.]
MDTAALLQAIYRCYREKRLADMLALFDDNFRMIAALPDDTPGAGPRPRSKAETALLTHKFLEDYDILEFELGPIVSTDGVTSTETRGKFRHKRTGNILDTTFRHDWRITGGKALELEHRHDVRQVEDFLSSLKDGA